MKTRKHEPSRMGSSKERLPLGKKVVQPSHWERWIECYERYALHMRCLLILCGLSGGATYLYSRWFGLQWWASYIGLALCFLSCSILIVLFYLFITGQILS
jgi:hypothetical protein